MDALRSTATAALRALLSTQPNTPEKMRFAWRIAAGPAMSRAVAVDWSPERGLRVRPRSETWRREIARARPVIVERLGQLVGEDLARRFAVEAAEERGGRHRRRATSEE